MSTWDGQVSQAGAGSEDLPKDALSVLPGAPSRRNEYSDSGISGNTSGISTLEVTWTLGDLLKELADLLQDDVKLCMKLIGALRHSEKIATCPLSVEAKHLQQTVSAILKDKGRSHGERDRPTSDAQAMINRDAKIQVSQDYSGIPQAGGDPNGSSSAGAVDARVGGGVESDAVADRSKRPPWFPSASHGGLPRNMRQRIFVLFDDASQSICGKIVEVLLILTIIVSTVSFVAESMPEFRSRPPECAERRAAGLPLTVKACEPQPDTAFFNIEAVCIAIFSMDYLCRILTCHATRKHVDANPIWSTLNYAREPLNLIDLIAVLPFYFGVAMGGSENMGILRILRLARILRLFKAAKHHPGIMMFWDVMVMSGQPLLILVFFNVIITILFGALIYYAEGQRYSVASEFTQPSFDSCANASIPAKFPQGVYVRKDQARVGDEPSPFRSIPYSLWWVSVTMTTVGYGDYSPTTVIGKAIGVICFYVGIIFLALPISVLGSNFESVYTNRMDQVKKMSVDKTQSLETKAASRKKKRPLAGATRETPFIPSCTDTRKKLFLLFDDPTTSTLGKYISIFVICTILVSTVCFIMESMPDFNYTPDACDAAELTVENCQPQPDPAFYSVEVICIIIFSIDYVLRVSTVHAVTAEEAGLKDQHDGSPGWKISVLYCMQWLNIIDILAIVPFYIELMGAGGGGASVFRVLRLVRVFRVLKMPKMRACAEMFIDIVEDALPALFLLFFMTLLMCVLFASLIFNSETSRYVVDHAQFMDEYPDGLYIRPTADGYDYEASPFQSILYAFWWFFTTATTVGYGDDYPTTTAGRCVGVMSFYTGIILLALPITIVGGCVNNHYPDWVKEFSSEGKDAVHPIGVDGGASPAASSATSQVSPKLADSPGIASKGLQENAPQKAWG